MAVAGHVAPVRLHGREAARTRRLGLSEALQDLELCEEGISTRVPLTYDELADYRSANLAHVEYVNVIFHKYMLGFAPVRLEKT
jgi:hypothetical protein